PHLMVKLGSLGLSFCKAWTVATGGIDAKTFIARTGDRVMLKAVRQAIGILGRHFVLGTSIENALKRAERASGKGASGTRFSFDMLGEAARTQADADRYFDAYKGALEALAARSDPSHALHDAPALSVKLSALHPRYEYAKRETCVPVLVNRLLELSILAKSANLGLTVDAEEADRLETSLLVFEQLLAAPETADWNGLGLVIQAYQRRALSVIDGLTDALEAYDRTITVRLVKGAYWDSEIKRAQELGLADYPVFTRKAHTDANYLACARRLLARPDLIYPQFATHNAHSAAAILHMAGGRHDFEFQRLHGMSDGLHTCLHERHNIRIRTYAPVGRHKELLPYLVRRLLENGANNSFVNQLLDPDTPIDSLVRDPISETEQSQGAAHPLIHAPCDHFGGARLAASGLDLSQAKTVRFVEALPLPRHQTCADSTRSDLTHAIAECQASLWPDTQAKQRADILRRAADLLETHKPNLMARCVSEAGKTWRDADAEVREAVDFLRYYANQATRPKIAALAPLGAVACISPWNFPLAIFLGQVSAALAVGNTVIAKPAAQTPLIAQDAAALLYEAGLPRDALHLIFGGGEIGAALTKSADIHGVCFTGSTATASLIQRALVETERGEVPLIAETGGLNAMLVDSTALLEQVVQDVVDSAFQSAGQRCSACRIVCVQSDIADAFVDMLAGAMSQLEVGDPRRVQVDVGPVIDSASKARIDAHIQAFRARHSVIAEARPATEKTARFVTPIAFELDQVSDLKAEIFGPVLHLVRFTPERFEQVIEEINALGYGLTMGLHTRIDRRVERVAAQAKVGNLYINRNQIGAVVGVQPFGGRGLSGTGPKAGGPNYLPRLCQPRINLHPVARPAALTLPGPTGETNTLSYEPRGRLLCLGGDDPAMRAEQIAKAEATGNQVIRSGLGGIDELVSTADIQGVVADGVQRMLAAKALTQRPGALLPLLSAQDPAERFCVEKTVTVNTTAAGGNAALLAKV
ncbi:MAG: L-glutamate gamma-semialdehyde dehydrogenase, partial [Pseudomonadota bacterium]